MHHIYENIFNNTPAMDLKLIVGNRNRRNQRNDLVQKRPKKALLQYQPRKSKYAISLYKLQLHHRTNHLFSTY